MSELKAFAEWVIKEAVIPIPESLEIDSELYHCEHAIAVDRDRICKAINDHVDKQQAPPNTITVSREDLQFALSVFECFIDDMLVGDITRKYANEALQRLQQALERGGE